MADFEGIYNELRKTDMNSVCQGKSTVEKYIPFKYNQTAVQKNQSKPFHFFVCSGILKEKSVTLFSIYNWTFQN